MACSSTESESRKILLVQLSSVAVEGLFSILNSSFKLQDNTLQDTSVMLQVNRRAVKTWSLGYSTPHLCQILRILGIIDSFGGIIGIPLFQLHEMRTPL